MTHAEPFCFADVSTVSPHVFLAEIPPGITSVPDLLQAVYERLQLPGYFGFNWDALSDCLRDFHWVKPGRVVMLHADLPALPLADLRTYLEVLAEAKASWGPADDHSLEVVFPIAARNEVLRNMP